MGHIGPDLYVWTIGNVRHSCLSIGSQKLSLVTNINLVATAYFCMGQSCIG